MLKAILPLTTFLIILVSCGNDPKSTKDLSKDKDKVEDKKDITAPIKKDTVISKNSEAASNKAKIEQKFGEQWEFCDCIVRLDSITDAFEKKTTPAQEEKLMARWEYVDVKCKEVTTNASTTPEERVKHENKVKKCLKANGLKK